MKLTILREMFEAFKSSVPSDFEVHQVSAASGSFRLFKLLQKALVLLVLN